MAKRLMPLLNRVLVQKIIPPSKTHAGILLPETTTKTLVDFVARIKPKQAAYELWKLNSGKVVAVGPGLRDKEGQHVPVSVKEGDAVLLPEYGGTSVKLGEKEKSRMGTESKLYHLYRDDDILGTLHD